MNTVPLELAARQNDWQPTASLDAIRARAAMLAAVRSFFAARDVLEVETPVLSNAGTTDPNIDSLMLGKASGMPMYLNSSPEFAMKRLLAAGSGDIYQTSRVFRGAERGRLHNPEFSLLEWYRHGFDLMGLMTEVAELLADLLARPGLAVDARFVSYRSLFVETLGLDPLNSDMAALREVLHAHKVALPRGQVDGDGLLDLIMSTLILPRLAENELCFVYDFPVSQAALARAHPDNPALARRFEAMLGGMELANGFEELEDATEQRARFESDSRRRALQGAPAVQIDERLLAALEHGFGLVAGVAVGLDRVLMLKLGAAHIDEVLCFPPARA